MIVMSIDGVVASWSISTSKSSKKWDFCRTQMSLREPGRQKSNAKSINPWSHCFKHNSWIMMIASELIVAKQEGNFSLSVHAINAPSMWKEYAREAIIKWLLFYSMFMINTYFSCYSVLIGNVDTCLTNKQVKVHSKTSV